MTRLEHIDLKGVKLSEEWSRLMRDNPQAAKARSAMLALMDTTWDMDTFIAVDRARWARATEHGVGHGVGHGVEHWL